MEPGLYLTFFAEGETLDQELPPVGPLEHVVIRARQIVADRAKVHRSAGPAAGGRSNEAELELQRALGSEPGGARRPHLRIAALGGVYLRFASFGDPAEQRPLPELGPYRVVVLGPRGVEADGELLAAPSGRTSARWELTGRAAKHGKEFMPDIAFRTRLTSYHAGLGRNGARAGGEYGHERRWHRQGGAELPLDVQRGQRATGNDCRVGSRPRGLPCPPTWRDLSRP